MRQQARFLLLFCLAAPLALAQEARLRGFPADGGAAQRELEQKLKAGPQPDNIRRYMQVMAEEPHHTGSQAGRRVAGYVAEKFREWGLETQIAEFEGLMPTPREIELEMIEPERFRAALEEPAIPEDKDSSDSGQLPPFNAYSPDGEATAQIVYVNYGMPDDYTELEKLGVDVKGKIVLARYYGGWRGIKPKVAAEHGAIGCIIYSDPRDDGFFQADPYPEGPARPLFGVQRGSTMDMPTYPGDPLSPGWASVPGSRRLEISEAKTLPRIPVLPISAEDALPLLENLRGPVAPESWRGALPLTYHVGPGPAKVRMKVSSQWKVRTGLNVIGMIPGAEFPDEWVLYGNHHDAWVNGATDPVSGNAVLMETARVLAEQVKEGWRPKRTIVFASWDAEEWGLIGSTEWGEKHASELKEKAVAYINTDSNRQGVLSAAGSHILERFINDVARDVEDPLTGESVWRRMREQRLEKAKDRKEKEKIRERADLRIDALGSGSDYTVFIDHLTIPSVNLSFREEGPFGVYHSAYDSLEWYGRFGDPQLVYGRTLAQFNAVGLSRLADAAIVPYEFTNLTDTLQTYLDELKELEEDKKAEGAEVGLDFSPAEGALKELAAAAQDYEKTLKAAFADGGAPANTPEVNRLLRGVERAMGRPEGLPKREWYKHHVYAPGYYTGYGVKTVPGVRESIEQDQWATAREQIQKFAEVLEAVTSQVRRAEGALRDGG